MVRLFLTFLCWWASFFRSRHDLALQIISLRQQLIVLKRKNPRPRLSPMGSAVLGCVATLLVEMGRGVNPRETGDGSELASRRVSPLLGLSFSPTPGTAKNYLRSPCAYSSHGQRESPLGSTQDSWRTAKAGL